MAAIFGGQLPDTYRNQSVSDIDVTWAAYQNQSPYPGKGRNILRLSSYDIKNVRKH